MTGILTIRGTVERGRQLGRKLGFPTVNVTLREGVYPSFGVYVARTQLWDGRILGGVASVGVNPTTGVVQPRMEVWLFDFDEEIYGRETETELVRYLRGELLFLDSQGNADICALVAQVKRDGVEARRALYAVAQERETSKFFESARSSMRIGA